MPLVPGDSAMAGTSTGTHTTGAGVETGDAVMLSGGEMVPVDSDVGTLAGVARDGGALGTRGAFVAAVAAGVTDGQRLAGGRDATGDEPAGPDERGLLVADPDGPAFALCDEGGTWHGRDIPAGYAVVELCIGS